MIGVLLAELDWRLQKIRRERDVRERGYLRSLKWTDEQLVAFQERIRGVHDRADLVMKRGNR